MRDVLFPTIRSALAALFAIRPNGTIVRRGAISNPPVDIRAVNLEAHTPPTYQHSSGYPTAQQKIKLWRGPQDPPHLKGYFFGGRTRQCFVPPMFFMVPPIPAFRMALTALPMSFCGTCSTFLGAPLFFSRRAAEFNPAGEPLRSTSVARPPPFDSASSRCPPRNGTSVLPPGPAARLFARRCARDSDIARMLLSTLLFVPQTGDMDPHDTLSGVALRVSRNRLPGMTKAAARYGGQRREPAFGYQ